MGHCVSGLQYCGAQVSKSRCAAKLKGSGFLIILKNTAVMVFIIQITRKVKKKILVVFRSGKIARFPGGLVAKITSHSLISIIRKA